MFDKIINYIKDSVNELKKVNWISKKETLELTLEVVLFVLIFLVIYGIFDALLFKIIVH